MSSNSSQRLTIAFSEFLLGDLAVLVGVGEHISQAVVGVLLVHVFVHDQTILWRRHKRLLVGEAPSLIAHAVWLVEADVHHLAVKGSLSVEVFLLPVPEWAVLILSALDTDLRKVDLDADLVVSLDVLPNGIKALIVVREVFVELEADAIDAAASLLQVLDKVEDLVGLALFPAGRGTGGIVVIVEEFGMGTDLLGFLEDLASNIWNLRPW